ncbi:hypothetical protein GCM10007385_15640 [Tateyamaria omphalii]|uniref:hypothetical protein n=1 Tax=Tateyamaria omphalii TaxID=299262 RepID=UPI00167573BC|nr:hypothetical protein [Tateyamaria omphalii]GGX48538.1 hypothetical protein GCM10007385_15640 [Tateyamaria omphalii]
MIDTDGFVVFDHDDRTARWASAAEAVATGLVNDPETRLRNLRHGDTWFVGVDVLPNDADGGVSSVPLAGPWQNQVPELPLHFGQVSIVYPGYPKRDADQSEANHLFRIKRMAGHVDGLLPEGARRRRYAREVHAYILGLPLNDVPAAPTVVWKGSHKIMQNAFQNAIADQDPREVDITDAYQAARRSVFDSCEMVPIRAKPGQSFLIHRFAVHGTAPWEGADDAGRMIAFFRPEFPNPADWLNQA